MSKPRLLIVLNRLVVGGQSLDTIPLANYLKHKYDILIVHGKKEPDEVPCTEILADSSGISFKKINSLKRSINPLNDISSLFSLYKIIKIFKPDIIHTHGSKPGVAGRVAAWGAKVPVIIHTFHGHLFHSYYNKYWSDIIIRFEKLLGKVSTKIVVLSQEQKAEIIEKYKITGPSKIEVIPLGVDENVYTHNSLLMRSAFRKIYHLSEDCVAICIVGRMVPVKNHRFFIDIIISLLPEIKSVVKFFLVGDGELKKKLQNQLTKAKIDWSNGESNFKADVIFTSWVTPVTTVLHGMDIVTVTSLNEGTPMSLIEAQICSKPVVAVNVGGVKDTFINKESGFLIEEHSIKAFEDKLKLLIENKDLRKCMGEKGYAFARERFSKQAEVNSFNKMYKNCLALLKK